MTRPTDSFPAIPSAYLERVRTLLTDGRRKLLGLVGPPGSGKSTLAAALQREFSQMSQIIPMDGFHLANEELRRLGRAGRKGAADTFDSAGYVALLQRLRDQKEGEVIYAPEFRREIEEPVAGAIPVHAETRLIITEGNYLLLDSDSWARVPELLDDIWYVRVDDNLRRQRLVARHQHFGRSERAALDWVEGTDEPNARLIASTRRLAHVDFQWDTTTDSS
jgi:pantothenate kinase